MILRVLGFVLGLVWMIGGPVAVLAVEESTLLRAVYIVGFIGTGTYFLYYALTGRSNLNRNGVDTDKQSRRQKQR